MGSSSLRGQISDYEVQIALPISHLSHDIISRKEALLVAFA
jgi:hypothetical protein